MTVFFENVTIIGVGLIGGSLARALKAGKMAGVITGAGRSASTLDRALQLGVIDRADQDLPSSVRDADLIVLATPVASFKGIVREIGHGLKPGAIVTDVGSVKAAIVADIKKHIPPGVHLVPAHPIAGREKSGVAASTDRLFQGKRCILTPDSGTDRAAIEAVRAMWTQVGSDVVVMDGRMHDHIFAAVSHLPHVAAFAMMDAVAGLRAGSADYLHFSGAGFRDFTRIAASSPVMWRDIFLMNSGNLVQMIDRYVAELNRYKEEISAGSAELLEEHLKISSDARKRLE